MDDRKARSSRAGPEPEDDFAATIDVDLAACIPTEEAGWGGKETAILFLCFFSNLAGTLGDVQTAEAANYITISLDVDAASWADSLGIGVFTVRAVVLLLVVGGEISPLTWLAPVWSDASASAMLAADVIDNFHRPLTMSVVLFICGAVMVVSSSPLTPAFWGCVASRSTHVPQLWALSTSPLICHHPSAGCVRAVHAFIVRCRSISRPPPLFLRVSSLARPRLMDSSSSVAICGPLSPRQAQRQSRTHQPQTSPFCGRIAPDPPHQRRFTQTAAPAVLTDCRPPTSLQ